MRRARHDGQAIKRIARDCGRSPSTVLKYVGDIVLSAQAVNALMRREPPPRSIEASRRGGEALAKSGKWKTSLARARLASGLVYLPEEKPIRSRLEKLYSTSLCKEKIGSRFFDFVNDAFLIEHTRDVGKGIGSATDRFQVAHDAGDTRRRVVFLHTASLGRVRRARLEALSVEIHDVAELDQLDPDQHGP